MASGRRERRHLTARAAQIVQQSGGGLQVIALDHAEFEEEWFAGSVIQRWRGGDALIPASWYES